MDSISIHYDVVIREPEASQNAPLVALINPVLDRVKVEHDRWVRKPRSKVGDSVMRFKGLLEVFRLLLVGGENRKAYLLWKRNRTVLSADFLKRCFYRAPKHQRDALRAWRRGLVPPLNKWLMKNSN